jgi:hypothetical protein
VPPGAGDWVTLSPRQELTAAPYALHSRSTEGISVAGDVVTVLGPLDVAGDLDVDGGITYRAVKKVDGGAETPYAVSAGRYYVEATQAMEGTSVPISQSIIESYCGDEDGCRITIGIRNWDGQGRSASVGPHPFFYSVPTGRWRLGNLDTEGTDGDGQTEHVATLHSDVYLTDGVFIGGAPQGDPGQGLSLLNWNGYSQSDVFVIIDD